MTRLNDKLVIPVGGNGLCPASLATVVSHSEALRL